MDARLFSSILARIDWSRRAAVEEWARDTAPFAAGTLALRCLDKWFRQGAERRGRAVARELLSLEQCGCGAAALGGFLVRFRLLTA